MIQRKQSIYLLLITIALTLLFFIDLAIIVNPQASYALKLTGVYEISNNSILSTAYPLVIIAITSILLTFYTIFSYKKRSLQLRLCGLNALLLIGIIGFAFYYGNASKVNLNATISYSWVIIMPIISIVFNVLAFLAISADEALVKSMNRLR